MKSFIAYKIVGEPLGATQVTEAIANNPFTLGDFKVGEMSRRGFVAIHKKLSNTFIDHKDFVLAKFKMAHHVINKAFRDELIAKIVSDKTAKGEEIDYPEIEASIAQQVADNLIYKFKTVDVLFDLKNNTIYTNANEKFAEEYLTRFILNAFSESKLKLCRFMPQYDHQSMTRFILAPDATLPKHVRTNNCFASIEKRDGTLLVFKHADLNDDEHFKSIVSERDIVSVNQIGMVMSQNNSLIYFTLNKKGIPTSISIAQQGADSNEPHRDSQEEGQSNMAADTAEAELYDELYAQAIIMYHGISDIADFTLNSKHMNDYLERNKN